MSNLPVPMATGNFLVPNFTFVIELVAFVIILWILGKYVIPPVNKAMTARQEAIRKQFDELEQAKADARAAEESFKKQLTEARHEAAKIREDAREQGAAIIADMRKQAQEESDRILKHTRTQLEAERQQLIARVPVEHRPAAPQRGGRHGHRPGRPDRGRVPRGRRAPEPDR